MDAMVTPGRRLMRVFSLVRYRFFLYAGLLPYLLGAAWAFAMAGTFDAALFWSGFGGVVLSVIGVEAFNEYFDARMGTDRVFNPDDLPPIAQAVFWIGSVAFAGGAAGTAHESAFRLCEPAPVDDVCADAGGAANTAHAAAIPAAKKASRRMTRSVAMRLPFVKARLGGHALCPPEGRACLTFASPG